MTTERGSYDDSNVDQVTATREDEMTASGLSDAPFPAGAGTSSTGLGTTAEDTAWATGGAAGGTGTGSSMGSSRGSMGSSGSSMGSGDRLTEAAGGVAQRVADTAQQQASGAVNTQLSRGADMLDQVSRAIRQSGEQLRGEQPQVAGFADMAAGQVDRFGSFLRQQDLNGLVRETEDLARRQPALFLGGALLLGVAASRFLKASPQGGSSFGGGMSQGYGGYGSGTGDRFSGGSSYGRPSYGGSSYGASTVGGGSYGSSYGGGSTAGAGGYGGGSGYAGTATGTSDMTSSEGGEHGGV